MVGPPAAKQGCSLGAAQALGAVAIIIAAAAVTNSDVLCLILMCTRRFPVLPASAACSMSGGYRAVERDVLAADVSKASWRLDASAITCASTNADRVDRMLRRHVLTLAAR